MHSESEVESAWAPGPRAAGPLAGGIAAPPAAAAASAAAAGGDYLAGRAHGELSGYIFMTFTA